jgi:hypothetical protein
MPRTKRDKLRRYLANAISYIDDSLAWIMVLHEVFLPVHPEHAAYLQLTATLLLQAQEQMKDFWLKTWGPGAENWKDWATVMPAFERGPKEVHGDKTE